MTNKEEVIEHLLLLKESAVKSHNDTGIINVKLDSFNFVMDMAIKALEQQSMPTMVYPQVEGITPVVVEPIPKLPPVNQQEPCDDAISRQAVLDLLEDTNNGWIINEVLQLPTVTPQEPKTGHWIAIDEEPHEDYECDKCGYVVSTFTENIEPHTEYKFCPNCGCRMVNPQESEEV